MINTSSTDYVNKKKEQINMAPTTLPTVTTTTETPKVVYQSPTHSPTVTTTMEPPKANAPTYEPPKIPSAADLKPSPFQSTSGSNAKAYVDSKSANLGKDPGYTSEAGRLYGDQVTKSLTAPDASSVNVQNQADTNNSRRAYMANLQAGEAIGQSGFGAGTAQAQRMREGFQANTNSANLNEQNSASEYLRNRTEQNLNRASNLETQQYNKGRTDLQDAQGQDLTEYGRSERATDRGLDAAKTIYNQGRDSRGDYVNDRGFNADQTQQNFNNTRVTGRDAQADAQDTFNNNRTTGRDAAADAQTAIGNAHWDTARGDELTQKGIDNAHWDSLNVDNKAQRAFENTQVLKGSDEAAKKALINSLPDGPAKNAAILALNNGKNPSDVAAMVFNADGTLKIKGDSPQKLALEGEMEAAGQQAELEGLSPNTQAYLDRQKAIVLQGRSAKSQPIDDAAIKKTEADSAKRLSNGEPKDGDFDTLPSVAAGGAPIGADAVSEFLKSSNTGGWLKIDGTPYKVEKTIQIRTGHNKSGGYTHTDYTILTDKDGKEVFIDPRVGKVTNKPLQYDNGYDVTPGRFGE